MYLQSLNFHTKNLFWIEKVSMKVTLGNLILIVFIIFLIFKGDLNLKETECQEVASCLEEALSKTNDLKEEVRFKYLIVIFVILVRLRKFLLVMYLETILVVIM